MCHTRLFLAWSPWSGWFGRAWGGSHFCIRISRSVFTKQGGCCITATTTLTNCISATATANVNASANTNANASVSITTSASVTMCATVPCHCHCQCVCGCQCPLRVSLTLSLPLPLLPSCHATVPCLNDRMRQGRYDMRWGIKGTHFATPALQQKAPWLPLVTAVLGDDAVELWRGVVDNCYGSSDQMFHRDGQPLYPHAHLPPHAVTVFVPLVDVTEDRGPTEFLPGSHDILREHMYAGLADGACHLPSTAPLLDAGSFLMFDYRIIHRGKAHCCSLSNHSRPMMYIAFARKWFTDSVNFPMEPSLGVCPISAPLSDGLLNTT